MVAGSSRFMICPDCDKLIIRGGSHRCQPPVIIITPYTDRWPEYDSGSDSFSMEDSWIDRTGARKLLTDG